MSAQKLMIFGLPGSGKSTFACKLSKKLNLPLFHLDSYFYLENWVERDPHEFLNLQKGLVEKESWVIDGNCTASLEMRYAKADIVLYFRFSRLLCLWRLFKRLLIKDPSIKDLAEGCSNIIRWQLIKYMWKFDRRVEMKIKELQIRYPHVKFYILKNDADAKTFYQSLETVAS